MRATWIEQRWYEGEQVVNNHPDMQPIHFEQVPAVSERLAEFELLLAGYELPSLNDLLEDINMVA